MPKFEKEMAPTMGNLTKNNDSDEQQQGNGPAGESGGGAQQGGNGPDTGVGTGAGTEVNGSGEDEKGTDWKQHARTWEQRAKDNKQSEEAAISRAAAAEQRLQEMTEKETAARLNVRRMTLAVDLGMSREMAEEVFTATDEETLAAQEAAYRAGRESAPKSAESTGTRNEGGTGQPGPPKKDYKAIAAELRKRA